MRTPPIDLAPRPRRDHCTAGTPRLPTRRQRVTTIMNTAPRRAWSGRELAEQLLTQLAEWARLGFLTHTSAGTYALDTPP